MQQSTPFIVFGASKSGTTWLQKVINEHPDCKCHFQIPVFPLSDDLLVRLNENTPMAYAERQSPFKGLFETKQEEKEYFLMSDFLRSRDFLKADYVDKYIKESGKPFSDEDKKYLEGLHHKMMRGISRELLADEKKSHTGSKAYTDIEHYFSVFPEGKMLCIIRDGRDVVVSKRFHSLRMNAFMHGDERNKLLGMALASPFLRKAMIKANKYLKFISKSSFHQPPASGKLIHEEVIRKYGNEWKKLVNYILDNKKKYGEHLMVLKFEDLKSAPEETIKRIFEFLGVKDTPEVVAMVAENTNISKLKKDKDESGFFRKGAIGDWQNHFSEEHKQLFKSIAGEQLINLGYEKDKNW